MRLTKRQVEAMHRAYDDDPVAALTAALRVVFDQRGATWDELLRHPSIGEDRRAALVRHDVRELDRLFTDLNEERDIGP